MSHYTKIQTEFASQKYLVKALKAMGFSRVEFHSSPQVLYGVEGFARDEKAEIIIRRKYVGEASNDLGFARGADGKFRAIISEWDQQHYDERWLGLLAQRYSYFVACDSLQEQKFDLVAEDMDQDNNIRLTLRRMA